MGEMPQICNTVGKYNFIWEISPLQESVKKFQGVIATGETISCPNRTCQGHTCTGISFILAQKRSLRKGGESWCYSTSKACHVQPPPQILDKTRLAMVRFFTEMIDYLQWQPLPSGSTNMILPIESNTVWRVPTRGTCNILSYCG